MKLISPQVGGSAFPSIYTSVQTMKLISPQVGGSTFPSMHIEHNYVSYQLTHMSF